MFPIMRPASAHFVQTLNHQAGIALHRSFAPRLLQGLNLLQHQGNVHSGFSTGVQAQQRRHATTASVVQALNPQTSRALRDNFRFQKPNQSAQNIESLQSTLTHALGGDMAAPAYVTKDNPTAADIEGMVEQHGPVRLSLYGLLAAGEGAGGLPTEHTVLVIGTFNVDGKRYAVLVDGNHLAKSPVKAAVDAYARERGKELHELTAADFEQIGKALEKQKDAPLLEQAMYRVVDLDRTVEHHEATLLRYTNYLETLAQDLEKEGLHYPHESYAVTPGKVVCNNGNGAGGKLSAEQTETLAALVRSQPDIVEPFIPLQGPAASSDPFVQVPALEKVFNAPSTAALWKPPASREELQSALCQEPTFRQALDKPENARWLDDLHQALTDKQMPKGDRGVELIMRFKCTYGTVHHLAIGSMWRDGDGKLQLGVHHQEAVPITRKNWEGHVYPGFDTARDYPTGRAPVAESLKLAGMPDVKLLTTKYPDKIVGIANAMSGPDNAYPYGPNEAWGDSKWRFPADRPFITCSNTTLDTHDLMRGQYPVHKPTLPDLFKTRIAELNNTDYEKVKKIKVGDTTYSMDDIMQLPYEVAGAMFSAAGILWGNHRPWDVNAPRDVKDGRMPLEAGKDLRLPLDRLPGNYHGATFLNPRSLVTADGKPVERNVFYPRAEVEKMTYSADAPGKLIFIAAVPKGADSPS